MEMWMYLIVSFSLGNSISSQFVQVQNESVSPLDLTYYFYNLQNPDSPVEIKSNNTDKVRNTHFDSSKETIILIHGYGHDAQGVLVKTVKNKIINEVIDVNIIGLDWSSIWKTGHSTDFFHVVPEIGVYAAEFLTVLATKYGLDYSNLTIVGHSAGGPISGATGSALKGKVKYILGLDTYNITQSEAEFVEIIHTSRISKGGVGHADFYPNGGFTQPGCLDTDIMCSHMRVIDYYAESISSKKFIAKHCGTYEEYETGKCVTHSSSTMGGLYSDTKASGKNFLDTNSVPPYAKG